MDNAVRYTPEGGSIRLSAGMADGRAFFEVQDGGIGIAEEDVPRIFDRFFRADPARARASGGTGLGLSIARWIVERHDGHFEVLSRQELGTRIRVVPGGNGHEDPGGAAGIGGDERRPLSGMDAKTPEPWRDHAENGIPAPCLRPRQNLHSLNSDNPRIYTSLIDNPAPDGV